MTPLFGKSHSQYGDPNLRRLRLAEALMLKGADTSPVEHWAQGAARLGQAALGGYLSHKADEDIKAKEERRRQTLAEALKAGQDQPAPAAPTLAGGEAAATRGTGSAQQGIKGDPQKMAAILAGNEDTAPLGLQLQLGQMQFNQQRAAQKEDTSAAQNFQKELAGINQQFLTGQMTAQQAHAERMAAAQRAHAAGLQTAQQQFLTQQAQAQQTFQGAENQKNREAEAAQRQAAAALSKVPQGYQINPQGGVVPIPGSPQAQEAADNARAKAESSTSVERMIRSIDELAAHPGLEGTVGISFGQRHIPGTDAASFDARLETLKSQAFLPMVAQLKGMGQLSDAEGKKLTAAIGALDPRMSEKEFKASMDTIRQDMNSALVRMGGKPIPPPASPQLAPGLPPLPPGFQPVQ